MGECSWGNLVWRSVVPTPVMALLVSTGSTHPRVFATKLQSLAHATSRFLSLFLHVAVSPILCFSVSNDRLLLSSAPNSNHFSMQLTALPLSLSSVLCFSFSLFFHTSVSLILCLKWQSVTRFSTKLQSLEHATSRFLCFSCTFFL